MLHFDGDDDDDDDDDGGGGGGYDDDYDYDYDNCNLAYGGWARSTSGSQKLGVLTKQ